MHKTLIAAAALLAQGELQELVDLIVGKGSH